MCKSHSSRDIITDPKLLPRFALEQQFAALYCTQVCLCTFQGKRKMPIAASDVSAMWPGSA